MDWILIIVGIIIFYIGMFVGLFCLETDFKQLMHDDSNQDKMNKMVHEIAIRDARKTISNINIEDKNDLLTACANSFIHGAMWASNKVIDELK